MIWKINLEQPRKKKAVNLCNMKEKKLDSANNKATLTNKCNILKIRFQNQKKTNKDLIRTTKGLNTKNEPIKLLHILDSTKLAEESSKKRAK